jgi:hypothetical protein
MFLTFIVLSSACIDAGPSAPSDAAAKLRRNNGEALKVLAQGEDAPWRVAVDERYVYWTTRSELRRAPLSGGAVTTLATGSFVQIVAADGGVFASDGVASKIYRVERESGEAKIIGTGEQPDGIAVHGDKLYWANGAVVVGTGSLAQSNLDGTDHALLASELSQPSGVAADDEFVYFTSTSQGCDRAGCVGGGVTRLSLEDRSRVVLDQKSTPLDVVLGERGAYWVSGATRVMFASSSSDNAEILTTVVDEEGPVAVDSEAVYLASKDRGRVLKISLDGGRPEPIATDLGTIGGIASDDLWLYVTSMQQGRVLRIAKDGSAAVPPAPVTGPCPTPLGAAADIAATPRSDPNLELLALSIDHGRVTANEETYSRVVADVAAMREANPQIASIKYFPRTGGRELLVYPNEQTMQLIRGGNYSAWNCLNDFYRLQSMELGADDKYYVLGLKGMYDLDLVSQLYKELPGITDVEPNRRAGDGPTICAKRNGSEYEYVVDRADGDCPSGCTIHEAHHFLSSAAGVIEARGVWNSETNEPPPEWFSRICR